MLSARANSFIDLLTNLMRVVVGDTTFKAGLMTLEDHLKCSISLGPCTSSGQHPHARVEMHRQCNSMNTSVQPTETLDIELIHCIVRRHVMSLGVVCAETCGGASRRHCRQSLVTGKNTQPPQDSGMLSAAARCACRCIVYKNTLPPPESGGQTAVCYRPAGEAAKRVVRVCFCRNLRRSMTSHPALATKGSTAKTTISLNRCRSPPLSTWVHPAFTPKCTSTMAYARAFSRCRWKLVVTVGWRKKICQPCTM
jgi:hypothetical protein